MDNFNKDQENNYRVDPDNNSYKYTGAENMQNNAQGNTQYSSQNNAQGNTQYNSQNNTQSAYSSPYGNYSYTTSTSTKQEKPKRDDKGHLPFGKLIGRAAAVAVVFGLVAGSIFGAVNYIIPDNKSNTENVLETTKDKTNVDTAIATDDTGHTTEAIQTTSSNKSNSEIIVTDVSDIVEDTMPSIVAITNMSVVEYRNLWGQTYSQDSKSAGSGIIVSQDENYIYIATNNHVVEDATTLTVQFCDGTAVAAEVKGTNEQNDLAVVKVELSAIESETREKIKVAVLDDSGDVKVGEAAIAIGNALGYGQSVTVGVVSALDREVTSYNSDGTSVTNTLIQTDAAINHGNSGGALLNIRGEVIGINSAKYESVSIEGMGFSIPMDVAAPIINDLITREKVEDSQASYLGINGVDVTSSIAASYGMPEGICIAKVYEGSPAEEAGLTKGDIIYEFDGQSLAKMEELQELMQYRASGSEVEIKYYRANNGEYEENSVVVTLGKKY